VSSPRLSTEPFLSGQIYYVDPAWQSVSPIEELLAYFTAVMEEEGALSGLILRRDGMPRRVLYRYPVWKSVGAAQTHGYAPDRDDRL